MSMQYIDFQIDDTVYSCRFLGDNRRQSPRFASWHENEKNLREMDKISEDKIFRRKSKVGSATTTVAYLGNYTWI